MNRNINSDSIILSDDKGNELLSITEKLSDGIMYFKVTGELSAAVSYDFEDELIAVASVCRNIHLDLYGVTYISSVALRTLLEVQQITDRDNEALFRITDINESLFSYFRENGYDQLFIIDR